MSATPGEGAYIPLTHRYAGAPDQLATKHVIEKMRPWLEDPKKPKVGQNTKYDRHVFANHGVNLQGVVHDTLLQSYVLQSHQRHDMDALATRFLGATGLLTYVDVAGKGAAMIPFDQVSIDRASAYSAEDADVTCSSTAHFIRASRRTAGFIYSKISAGRRRPAHGGGTASSSIRRCSCARVTSWGRRWSWSNARTSSRAGSSTSPRPSSSATSSSSA